MAYFDKTIFEFLRNLKENNSKDWFNANKEKYEGNAREPFLNFIADFAPHLTKIAPNHLANASKSGGSLFRIHKDLRFGNRDEPYKTWMGAYFKHNKSKDVHTPGFYLHIEPKNCFFGAGVWHPDTQTAQKIRLSLAQHTKEWEKIKTAKEFQKTFTMEGDSLKKLPKGFDTNHPHIEDLMRKDFIISHKLKQEDIISENFLKDIVNLCKISACYVEFLTKACGLKWD